MEIKYITPKYISCANIKDDEEAYQLFIDGNLVEWRYIQGNVINILQIATENGQQGHIFRPVWDMPPVGNNYSTVFLTWASVAYDFVANTVKWRPRRICQSI